ncbi:hypothetical protein FXO37_10541 [Capsicum annuum]|nr:hypothetical protein FXO37_10541 [Capsicum annuum]
MSLLITYQDKATQTDIIEDDALEKILKTLTTLSIKVDSMGNEIEKLKTNETKLKSKAMNQITQQCAELCRSEDIKISELKGDVGTLHKAQNVYQSTITASDHDSEIRQFSSVDAVSSLLYKTAASNNSQNPSVLTQMVDLRSITSSIIPQDYVGNASTFFYVPAANEEQMELHRLVSEMQKEKKEVQACYRRRSRPTVTKTC